MFQTIDLEIRKAVVPDDLPRVPLKKQMAALRDERDMWLVVSAENASYPSSVLAKAAGFRTMSAYRQALSRARKRLGERIGED